MRAAELPAANGVTNAVLGGWQLQAVWQRNTGAPIAFGNLLLTGDIRNLPAATQAQYACQNEKPILVGPGGPTAPIQIFRIGNFALEQAPLLVQEQGAASGVELLR